MKRIGGIRRKKIGLFTKRANQKGKISIRNYLAEFDNGAKVALVLEPVVQAGIYHPRFAGKTGTIISRKGSCYEVRIMDMNKEKHLIIHPVHLKRL